MNVEPDMPRSEVGHRALDGEKRARTSRALTSWVEPIAARESESAALFVEVARSIPADLWARPSPLEGWTYKDLLAHLARSNHRLI